MKRRVLLTTAGATVAVCCSGCVGSQSPAQPDVILDGVTVYNGDTDRHEFEIELERNNEQVHDSTETLAGSTETPPVTGLTTAEKPPGESQAGTESLTSNGSRSKDGSLARDVSRTGDESPSEDESIDDRGSATLSCTWTETSGQYLIRTRIDDGDWNTHAVLENVDTDADYVHVRIEYRPHEAEETPELQFFDLIRSTTLESMDAGCSYAETDS